MLEQRILPHTIPGTSEDVAVRYAALDGKVQQIQGGNRWDYDIRDPAPSKPPPTRMLVSAVTNNGIDSGSEGITIHKIRHHRRHTR
jgi:hypothetical protein